MRKFFAFLCACFLLLSCVTPAAAQDGEVRYLRSASKFIFEPGSRYSPTDLFPNFKDVMPGDSLLQTILVKNDVANKCKVKIFMRAKGAHEDSEAFLSQLFLTVTKNSDTFLFDAPADETAQLTDWVYLGTLYSGGKCELTVALDVPVELDNQFQNKIGYLDWEFAVEEYPVEDTDPQPPKTGDYSRIPLWTAVMFGSMGMLLILLLGRRKKDEND